MIFKELSNKSYIDSDQGSVAMEYALIAALLSVSIYVIVFIFGDNVLALFQYTMDAILEAAIAAGA